MGGDGADDPDGGLTFPVDDWLWANHFEALAG